MVNYNNPQQLDFLDMLAIMAFVIQVMDYNLTVTQASNDDVIKELHRQNAAYLERIEKQNERILELLGERGIITQEGPERSI